MGQVTLPIINRKGFSSVWENQWDTTLNYTKTLNEDMFLKKFFKIFFRNWLSSNEVFFSKNYNFKKIENNKNIRYKKFIFFQKKNLDNRTYLLKYKNKKFTYNYSKLFVLRFQKWTLLYIYIYVPKVWVTRIQKKQTYFFNKNYIDDLHKYHSSKLKFLNNK